MTQLELLEQNLKLLLESYQALRQENADLRVKNEDLREDAIRDKAEIRELRDRVNKLRMARALSETDESREAAKRQLTALIGKIDRALEVLKQ